MTSNEITRHPTLAWVVVIIAFFVALAVGIGIGQSFSGNAGAISIGFGFGMILLGYVTQLSSLSSGKTINTDSGVVIYAIRSSSWIIIVGLILVVLGFLDAMGLFSQIAR